MDVKTLFVVDGVIANIISGAASNAPEGVLYVEKPDDYRVDIGWAWDGVDVIVPPPPSPEPSDPIPDWTTFNTAFLSNTDWLAIAPQFSTPDIRTGIVSAAATANAGALQVAYGLGVADLTAQSISIDSAVLASWQEIANTSNIPVDFI